MAGSVSLQKIYKIRENRFRILIQRSPLHIFLSLNEKGDFAHNFLNIPKYFSTLPHTSFGLEQPIWQVVSLYKNRIRYVKSVCRF